MAYLVLENGMAFEGKRIGAMKDAAGEMVFFTGVVGYLETLSDPANAGHIVMQTFPVVGNYGVEEEDEESGYTPAGYVVRSLCDTPSNFRSTGSLNDYLVKKGIPGICGVDTRRLTAVLRQDGAKKTVALWDFGTKNSLISRLCQRGWQVKKVPFTEGAEGILSMDCDAVVLSGGPEGAHVPDNVLAQIRELLGKKPVLAVGLGHVLAAQALGGRVQKMHMPPGPEPACFLYAESLHLCHLSEPWHAGGGRQPAGRG